MEHEWKQIHEFYYYQHVFSVCLSQSFVFESYAKSIECFALRLDYVRCFYSSSHMLAKKVNGFAWFAVRYPGRWMNVVVLVWNLFSFLIDRKNKNNIIWENFHGEKNINTNRNGEFPEMEAIGKWKPIGENEIKLWFYFSNLIKLPEFLSHCNSRWKTPWKMETTSITFARLETKLHSAHIVQTFCLQAVK